MRLAVVASGLALSCLAAGCVAEPTSMPGSLDRVRIVDRPLSVGSKPASAFRPVHAVSFAYVAAVTPPTVSEITVQATNFAIAGDHGYVVYNNAGSNPILGGLDVLDLSHAGTPQLVASLVDTDAEFADVAASGDYVYAVGADASGGILRVWDVRDPTSPTVVTTFPLGSAYGTSLVLDHDTIYATVGADGGLATVDVSDPANPTLVRATPAANALAVVHKGADNLILFGETSLQLEGERDGTVWPLPELAASPVAAPGRMILQGNRAFVNAGRSGLTTLKVTGDGEAAEITAHAALDGTGNGIDASSQLLFLAQGEAGVQVFDLDGFGAPAYLGRLDFPNEPYSANQVRVGLSGGANQLLVGDGLGGFRIVSFDTH